MINKPRPLQVTGVVLLAVGIWWKFMLGPYTLLISCGPSNAPFVLTGTGAAIVLFGLFGCFATCRGRPWMLKLVRQLCVKIHLLTDMFHFELIRSLQEIRFHTNLLGCHHLL